MILRKNYLMVKKYLAHLREEKQLDEGTIKTAWMATRLLLEYADSQPLYRLSEKRPTLPEYLRSINGKLTGKPLTAQYQVKMLENIRHFYAWAKMYIRGSWDREVREAWVENLRVKRSLVNASKNRKEHVFWELEDVLKIARYEPKNLVEERMRASICFMLLSGMRVTAFCSLPLDCVDVHIGRIEQDPTKGVITKNRKSATTWFLPIPDLLPVVISWDTKIREADSLYWFAPLKLVDGEYQISQKKIPAESIQGRRRIFDHDIRQLCKTVGVPVRSAHKLRHGHGVYGVRNAQNIEMLKSVSQNMMHANIGITDGIYGVLPEENVRKAISQLNITPKTAPPAPVTGELPPELIQLARLLLEQMKGQK
jgi:integrase